MQIPDKWGRLLLTPKFTPELMSMMLLGPGVMPDENAKSAIVKTSSM